MSKKIKAIVELAFVLIVFVMSVKVFFPENKPYEFDRMFDYSVVVVWEDDNCSLYSLVENTTTTFIGKDGEVCTLPDKKDYTIHITVKNDFGTVITRVSFSRDEWEDLNS